MSEKELLRERAKNVANPIGKIKKAVGIRYLIFKRNKKLYSLKESDIIFIGSSLEVRLLTNIQKPFIGVVNYKGVIYNVIDIVEDEFHNKSDQIECGIIFLKKEHNSILYDNIIKICYIKEDDITTIVNSESTFFQKTFTYKDEEVLVMEIAAF